MTISKGKQRRNVTLSDATWEYLEEQATEISESRYWNRKATVSEVIEKLAKNDRKIKTAFGQK